jgi:hypothetical protein
LPPQPLLQSLAGKRFAVLVKDGDLKRFPDGPGVIDYWDLLQRRLDDHDVFGSRVE